MGIWLERRRGIYEKDTKRFGRYEKQKYDSVWESVWIFIYNFRRFILVKWMV